MKRIVFTCLFFSVLGWLNRTQAQEKHNLRGFKEGCLSGNCENGKGLFASFEKWFDDGIFKTAPQVKIVYAEGEFSNGKLKEGKEFHQYIPVKIVKYEIKNLNRNYTFSPQAKILSPKEVGLAQLSYEGQYKNGTYHGYGKRYLSNYVKEGVFVNGSLVMGTVHYLNPNDSIMAVTGLFTAQEYGGEKILHASVKYAYGFVHTGAWQGSIGAQIQPFSYGARFNYLNNTYIEKVWDSLSGNLSFLLTNQAMDHVVNSDPTQKTMLVQIPMDPFIKNYVRGYGTDSLLYTGQVKNGKPHGMGRLLNKNFLEKGIEFFYYGSFSEGKYWGPGTLSFQVDPIRLTGTLYYGQTGNLTYMDVQYFDRITLTGFSGYTGGMANGAFSGQGVYRTFHGTGGMMGEFRNSSGLFVGGLKHGTHQVSSKTKNGKEVYDMGTLTKSDIRMSASTLSTGMVVNYKGKVAAVVRVEPGKEHLGVPLSNGLFIPTNSFDFTVVQQPVDDFMVKCPICVGSGTTTKTMKTGYYTSYSTATVYSGSTVTGDYVKVTTYSTPSTYQGTVRCDRCFGSGKVFPTTKKN